MPIGRTLPDNINLNEEVEITIRGTVKRLEAGRKKDEDYKGSPERPAEMAIQINSVTLEGTTNTFTKIARQMDMMDD